MVHQELLNRQDDHGAPRPVNCLAAREPGHFYDILGRWLVHAWWIPKRISRSVPIGLLMAGVLLVVIVGLGLRLRHWERIALEQRLRLITVATVSVVYLVFLIMTSTAFFTGLAFGMDRFVLPDYVLFLWIGFWSLDSLVFAIKPHLANRKVLLLVGVGVTLAWIGVSSMRHIRLYARQTPS